MALWHHGTAFWGSNLTIIDIGVYLSANSSNCIHEICTDFTCQSYLKIVVFKKNII